MIQAELISGQAKPERKLVVHRTRVGYMARHIKKKLDKKWYDLLKEIDFSEIAGEIEFNDAECSFETSSEDFDLIIDEYIVARGMTPDQEECTECGRRLYMLYDLIFGEEV